METTHSSVGSRISKAIAGQAMTTGLAIIAACAAALNAEILRRKNQAEGAGLWASIKGVQGLHLLTALLSLFALVQVELERRARNAAPVLDAVRLQDDVEVR